MPILSRPALSVETRAEPARRGELTSTALGQPEALKRVLGLYLASFSPASASPAVFLVGTVPAADDVRREQLVQRKFRALRFWAALLRLRNRYGGGPSLSAS
jgi:hypothetical protein